jgi:hypothetical protein
MAYNNIDMWHRFCGLTTNEFERLIIMNKELLRLLFNGGSITLGAAAGRTYVALGVPLPHHNWNKEITNDRRYL